MLFCDKAAEGFPIIDNASGIAGTDTPQAHQLFCSTGIDQNRFVLLARILVIGPAAVLRVIGISTLVMTISIVALLPRLLWYTDVRQ
ncbi:hypothetical protein D9M68_784770 [compost metagenome]